MSKESIEAVKNFKEVLREEFDTLRGYRDNISMSFQDNFHRASNKGTYTSQDIRAIANASAEEFLNLYLDINYKEQEHESDKLTAVLKAIEEHKKSTRKGA